MGKRMHALDVGAGNEVTSYVFFIYTMIDNEMDVALRTREPQGCGEVFNSLSKDIIVGPLQGMLDEMHMSLSSHCMKPWNKLRAQLLVHTYPWATVSLIAATFLFALTVVQTAYSVASYYDQHHNNGCNCSPPPATTPSLPRRP